MPDIKPVAGDWGLRGMLGANHPVQVDRIKQWMAQNYGVTDNVPRINAEIPFTSASALKAGDIAAKVMGLRMISAGKMSAMLGEFPEYLKPVAQFLEGQREKLMSGAMTVRDTAKAYLMTTASQGSGAIKVSTLESKTGMQLADKFIEGGKIRPEEAMAAWLSSPEGKTALDALEQGIYDPGMWQGAREVRKAFGDDRLKTLNVFGVPAKGKYNLSNIGELAQKINQAGGNSKVIESLTRDLNGIGAGKTGFIKHLLGIGDTPTVDAVEINAWLTGKGDISRVTGPAAEMARQVKANMNDRRVAESISGRVKGRIEQLGKLRGEEIGVSPGNRPHILHHWLWDVAKGSKTSHTGMYDAMKNAGIAGLGYLGLRGMAGESEEYSNGRGK